MNRLSPTELKHDIVAYAHSLGFGRIGIASAEPLNSASQALGAWVDAGCAGEMDYMETNWPSRACPEDRLAGAKSVIALAVSYYTAPADKPVLAGEGKVARYAWGKDYHKVIEKRLASLARYIEAMAPPPASGTGASQAGGGVAPDARCKTYIDTGPLLERALAQKAGLGFIGKNTLLITRKLGSWVFLASVVTTLELPADGPDTRSCGSCTLCIDACPTQALTEPYRLDARRCISYLTIESKAPIPEELAPKVGNWVFGCDICQDVCPHNTRLETTPIREFHANAGVGPTLNLAEVLAIKTDKEFDIRFAGTPLKRAKRAGLQRNARAVLANQK